jgi:broad specificity phosphatase PhoE
MKAIFIRHGQSTGNAGIPCHDLALLELTETGWQQAREIAANWIETPGLIVTSPYLRTQQTAAPTIERFPDAPVEVWPIQEFTYLQPSRWNGTLSVERKPRIETYWKATDPKFCDGPGAESFATLLRRTEKALKRLESLRVNDSVLVFSHGQFIQAVRMLVLYPDATDRQRMEHFWRADGRPAIRNAELVETTWSCGRWQISSGKVGTRSCFLQKCAQEERKSVRGT